MVFTYIADAEYNAASSSSAVVNKPTGTVDDDIMFAVIGSDQRRTNSVPSGWTSIGYTNVTTRHYELFYKVASSEGTTYTWGFATSDNVRVHISTFRDGFNTSDPIDVVSNTIYSTANTTTRAASMTVSNTGSPLLFFGMVPRSSTVTFSTPTVPTTDWVEHCDCGSPVSDWWNSVNSMIWTGSGATGDMDSTISVATSAKHAFAVALSTGAGSVSGIKLGATTINKVYLGSTEINKVYLGSTQIFG